MNRHKFAIIYTILIIAFTVFVYADGFWLEKGIMAVESTAVEETEVIEEVQVDNFTENSYVDDNISIEITTDRQYDTDIYIVDVQIKNVKYLKTAFAKDLYGKNVLETTSSIASRNNAILAINGDYYGFREEGYVLRNGTVYRNTARKGKRDDYLIIYSDGDFKMGHEQEMTIEEEDIIAAEEGRYIWQIFTFGPALIEDSEIIDTDGIENANQSNPRTAIGLIEPLHYIIVCCDGRSDESKGLNLTRLSEYMLDLRLYDGV